MKKLLLTLTLFVYLNHVNAQTQTVGVFTHTAGSIDSGYVLYAPYNDCDTTYLINKCGKRIHTWPSAYTVGADAYLLPDGSILRAGHVPNPVFDACHCGTGGIIERIDWDGHVTWHYRISDSLQVQSHDIYPLPNGNILVDVWEKMTRAQALAAGRKPSLLGFNLYSAKVIELKPIGTDSAEVVWSWRLWDHLVQDYGSTMPNYGVVADHPELVNLNYINLAVEPAMSADWTHMNTTTYNPELDQVMISSHNFNEIWIIDHSTTTAEAASHSGGKHHKGGDLLYRWGNPAAYGRATSVGNRLYEQHDPSWITSGTYKDHILIFNNGYGRPGGYYSSVDIIKPPIDTAGDYTITGTDPYGPVYNSWSY